MNRREFTLPMHCLRQIEADLQHPNVWRNAGRLGFRWQTIMTSGHMLQPPYVSFGIIPTHTISMRTRGK
jgi:hypothetical protein